MRNLALGAIAAVSLGLAVLMLNTPLSTGNSIAGVASLFVGLVSLGLSLFDFFRQQVGHPGPAALADDLALNVEDQWLEEALVRRLRDPRVLPLAWSATSRAVADRPEERVLRIRLAGRLDGRFEDVIRQLADGYWKLPNRRLVVLGEPGAGKTVLGLLLTLGLLKVRKGGGPVPMLLGASSWDPVREPLDDWIVRALAVPYYSGREEIPRALLRHGLLLPIIDGLDEIPESARRSAIRRINQAIGGERPVVVTCRAAEYQDLIQGGSPVLRRAPVVEVLPIPSKDVIAYLREVDWPKDITDGWKVVFDHLRSESDSPLAAALSTPLMVSSARLVYQHGNATPMELLDAERFDSRYSVEEHLTNQLVYAAYDPDTAGEQGRERHWDGDYARRWLTFLARYLHDHRERDLAWWQMSQRLLSPWFAPAIGLGVGLILVLASAAVTVGLRARQTIEDVNSALLVSAFIGVGFALLETVFWSATAGRQPGRLSPTTQGSWNRLRRGFGIGIALPSVSVFPVLVGIIIVLLAFHSSEDNITDILDNIKTSTQILGIYLALAVVIGLAIAAHNWLDAPPTRSARVSVRESIIQDRRSAIVGALTAGTVTGALGLLAWVGGDIAGNLLFGALAHWGGWSRNPDLSELAHDRWRAALDPFEHRRLLIILLTGLLPGTVVGLLVLLTRAWTRFVVVRLALAARGRLPWRLLAFLADARERGLLRQPGGIYQFRHIRLQETLAAHQLVPEISQNSALKHRPINPALRRRLILSAGATIPLAGIAAFIGKNLPKNMSKATFLQNGSVSSVAFQPFGDLIAASSVSGRGGTLQIWHRQDGRQLIRIPYSQTDEFYSELAFHPKGTFLALASHSGLELWDISNITENRHESIWRWPGPIQGLAFNSQGNILAFGTDQGIMQLDLNTHKHQRILDGVVSVLGDSVRLAFRSGDSVRLAFSPVDDHLAVVIYDRGSRKFELTVYRLANGIIGEPIFSPVNTVSVFFGGITSLDFNRDGSLLALAIAGAKVQLWNIRTRNSLPRVSGPDPALAVAFSPASSMLAIGYGNGTIQLLDSDDPKVPRKLTGHTGAVYGLSFSSDGNWLVSAGDDSTVRLWDPNQ